MTEQANLAIDKKVELEGLHEDLIPYVEEGGIFGLSIRHPLLIESFFCKEIIPLTNERYIARAEYLEKALKDKDFKAIIATHQRPYRFEAYLRYIFGGVDPETSATFLKFVWVDSECPHINLDSWILCLDYLKETKTLSSTVSEIKAPLKIYRGVAAEDSESALEYSKNLAWTTDAKEAIMFAKRSTPAHGGLKSYVAETTIDNLDAVYFCCNSRNEQEVVVNPSKLHDIKIKSI